MHQIGRANHGQIHQQRKTQERRDKKKQRKRKKRQTQEKEGESEVKQADCGQKMQKDNSEEDPKKTCRRKDATDVEDLDTVSTNVTTQDTHWDMDSGGEKGTAITAANSTR